MLAQSPEPEAHDKVLDSSRSNWNLEFGFQNNKFDVFGALCESKYVFYGLVRHNALGAGFTILLSSGNQTLFPQ